MKVMIACLVFFFFLVAIPTKAQYIVKPGETLWGIAEKNLNSAMAWEIIYNNNSYLHLSTRKSIDSKTGKIIVKIYPGETLIGVTKEGVIEPAVRVVRENQSVSYPTTYPVDYSWLWWIPLFLFFILVLIVYGLSKKSPTQWRPIVPGGVSDNQATDLFLAQAYERYWTLVPGTQSKVRLSGIWGTKHRGIPVPVPHRYVQERAFRAMFQMLNGTQKEGFMLQGCGNDVHSGAWYIPFPGASVLEGWGEEVTVATTQQINPSISAVEQVSHPVEKDEIKFEMRRASDGQPAMVRLSGVDEKGDNTFEVKPGVVIIRYTPRS